MTTRGEMNSSGAVTAVNTFGPNGLLARGSGSSGSTGAFFYSWDLSGNLAQRVDAGGNVLDTALSDGFGRSMTTDGTADPFSGFGGQWGGYTDAQDGLTLFTHRFYDAATGRFLTRDPLGYAGGINLYGYCENDPVIDNDPSGCGIWLPPVLRRLIPPGTTLGPFTIPIKIGKRLPPLPVTIPAIPIGRPPTPPPPAPSVPGQPGNPANPTIPSSPTGPSGPGHSPSGNSTTGNTTSTKT